MLNLSVDMLNLSMAFTSQYLNDVKHFDKPSIVFISGLYKTECDSPIKTTLVLKVTGIIDKLKERIK